VWREGLAGLAGLRRTACYSGRPASSSASAWSMRANVSSKRVRSDQPSHGIVIDMITPTTAPATVRTASQGYEPCKRFSSAVPSGTPRPEQESQPGPAW
jgi:hypothetical protein